MSNRSSAIIVEERCPTCSGTCVTIDDGSMTGKPGEPVSCSCSYVPERPAGAPEGGSYTVNLSLSLEPADCACGGTGWLPDGGFYAVEGQIYQAIDERCPVHPTQ
ncbi:hypothetical protein [Streptomyces malaysiensis]|uniref:hypothetical protein n=1 Tax=Streptomyces malaysiensis TaxID=92644 RepID=UPI003692A35E